MTATRTPLSVGDNLEPGRALLPGCSCREFRLGGAIMCGRVLPSSAALGSRRTERDSGLHPWWNLLEFLPGGSHVFRAVSQKFRAHLHCGKARPQLGLYEFGRASARRRPSWWRFLLAATTPEIPASRAPPDSNSPANVASLLRNFLRYIFTCSSEERPPVGPRAHHEQSDIRWIASVQFNNHPSPACLALPVPNHWQTSVTELGWDRDPRGAWVDDITPGLDIFKFRSLLERVVMPKRPSM
ncbi:hypothetical protein B0T19DRAFT_432849, partial [Cercophora scortea]